jgi:hypothetical protein
MVLLCPRCQRANPGEAVFCHFDGIVLRQGVAGTATPGGLTQDYIFPSGRRCRTLDDFIQGLYYEWEDARDLLRRGELTVYFGRAGRPDLARTAREAQSNPDADIALHTFVSSLPANKVQGPRLDLVPRRIIIGPIHVGEQRQVELHVLNQGKGLLQGRLTVAEGAEWLKPTGEGVAGAQAPVKTGKDQPVAFKVDSKSLVAPQSYTARVTAVTNGGVAEMAVRLDVAALPFGRIPYQGAETTRDLAERMRGNPKPAIPLLESGEVSRWFAANGWTYPVQGQTAKGLAAVQQFFEGLGLSKPPPLQISESEFRFRCTPPEVAPGQFTLRTSAKKLVYAQIESEASWLRVITPTVSGQLQADVRFEVDSTLMEEARVHQASLRVTANAGQKFTVRVTVDLQGSRFGWSKPKPASSPAIETHPQASFDWTAKTTKPQTPFHFPDLPTATPAVPRPGRQAKKGRSKSPAMQAFWLGALLFFLGRFVLIGPADLYARLLGSSVKQPAPGTMLSWLQSPLAQEGFFRQFVLATWWVGAIVGLILVWRRSGRWTDLLCGVAAGAVAGLGGAATIGCLLAIGDAAPRALLRALPGLETSGLSTLPATLLWLASSLLWWGIFGGIVGLVLKASGKWGASVQDGAANILAELFRLVGFNRAAEIFLPQGSS